MENQKYYIVCHGFYIMKNHDFCTHWYSILMRIWYFTLPKGALNYLFQLINLTDAVGLKYNCWFHQVVIIKIVVWLAELVGILPLIIWW